MINKLEILKLFESQTTPANCCFFRKHDEHRVDIANQAMNCINSFISADNQIERPLYLFNHLEDILQKETKHCKQSASSLFKMILNLQQEVFQYACDNGITNDVKEIKYKNNLRRFNPLYSKESSHQLSKAFNEYNRILAASRNTHTIRHHFNELTNLIGIDEKKLAETKQYLENIKADQASCSYSIEFVNELIQDFNQTESDERKQNQYTKNLQVSEMSPTKDYRLSSNL